jgi:hypothetical protein
MRSPLSREEPNSPALRRGTRTTGPENAQQPEQESLSRRTSFGGNPSARPHARQHREALPDKSSPEPVFRLAPRSEKPVCSDRSFAAVPQHVASLRVRSREMRLYYREFLSRPFGMEQSQPMVGSVVVPTAKGNLKPAEVRKRGRGCGLRRRISRAWEGRARGHREETE